MNAAVSTGLEALAITDHDTLAGYDGAEPVARAAGLDLICGIELSTRFHGRSVHLLGYFVNAPPAREFGVAATGAAGIAATRQPALDRRGCARLGVEICSKS